MRNDFEPTYVPDGGDSRMTLSEWVLLHVVVYGMFAGLLLGIGYLALYCMGWL